MVKCSLSNERRQTNLGESIFLSVVWRWSIVYEEFKYLYLNGCVIFGKWQLLLTLTYPVFDSYA